MTSEKKRQISTNVTAEAIVKTNDTGINIINSLMSYIGLKIDKIAKIMILIKFKMSSDTISFCFKNGPIALTMPAMTSNVTPYNIEFP